MTKFHCSIIVKTVVLALIMHTVISQCDRKRIIHTIRYQDCIPKRILSFGCAGTCNSYTQPSASQSGQLVKHCECCQDSDRISRQARIICPNVQGDTPFKYVVVSLSIPTSCLCRPCSPLSLEVNPGEPDIFNNGKRTVNTTDTLSQNQTML